MPASNETLARVTKVLVHALGVEEDEVKPSATLQGDLGAESRSGRWPEQPVPRTTRGAVRAGSGRWTENSTSRSKKLGISRPRP